MTPMLSEKRWHFRGYLPHWEAGEIPQHIIFRLKDSLPPLFFEKWESKLQPMNETKREVERRRLIEETLDESYGECLLKRQEIARIVESALFYFNGERYFLHSWVVMPNHVHVLVTPMGINIMSAIVHSWKSFTAKEANRLLGRKGVFWQEEYFDRVIRNETHFRAVVEYIEYNPVRAGLCASITDWKFGSFLGARASRPL